MVQTPAASPSTPSEKLTTFINPTSQITVKTPPVLGNVSAPTNGSVTSVTTAPPSTAITAAAIWPRSLYCGRRSRASSIAPIRAIRHAPASRAQVWTVSPVLGLAPTVRGSPIVPGIQIAAATTTPARIARPPSNGVARSASPRSLGIAIAPTRRASRAARGVSTVATTIATTNANTASQYRMREQHGSRGRLLAATPLNPSACNGARQRLGDLRDHRQGLGHQLAPGHLDHPVSGREQPPVAAAVTLESGSMAVEGVPVDLHHKSLRAPQESPLRGRADARWPAVAEAGPARPGTERSAQTATAYATAGVPSPAYSGSRSAIAAARSPS